MLAWLKINSETSNTMVKGSNTVVLLDVTRFLIPWITEVTEVDWSAYGRNSTLYGSK